MLPERSRRAILTALFVSIVATCVSGCFSLQPISAIEQIRASKLIDQGVALMRTGALDEAEKIFTLAYEIGALPQALDGLGCIALRRGQRERAKQLFHQALDRDPGYSEAYGHLGYLAEEEGAPEEAKEMYAAALARMPTDAMLRNNIGVYLTREGQFDEGIAQLEAALILEPNRITDENLNTLETIDAGGIR